MNATCLPSFPHSAVGWDWHPKMEGLSLLGIFWPQTSWLKSPKYNSMAGLITMNKPFTSIKSHQQSLTSWTAMKQPLTNHSKKPLTLNLLSCAAMVSTGVRLNPADREHGLALLGLCLRCQRGIAWLRSTIWRCRGNDKRFESIGFSDSDLGVNRKVLVVTDTALEDVERHSFRLVSDWCKHGWNLQ